MFLSFTLAAETRYLVVCTRKVLKCTCADLAFVVLTNTPQWLLFGRNTASHVHFLNLTKQHMWLEFAAKAILTKPLKSGEWRKEQYESRLHLSVREIYGFSYQVLSTSLLKFAIRMPLICELDSGKWPTSRKGHFTPEEIVPSNH